MGPNQQNNVISDAGLIDVVCDFKAKMIAHVENVACTATSCNIPDIGSCSTETTSSSPSSVPSNLPTADPININAPTFSPSNMDMSSAIPTGALSFTILLFPMFCV